MMTNVNPTTNVRYDKDDYIPYEVCKLMSTLHCQWRTSGGPMIDYEKHFFVILIAWLDLKQEHEELWNDFERICDDLADAEATIKMMEHQIDKFIMSTHRG